MTPDAPLPARPAAPAPSSTAPPPASAAPAMVAKGRATMARLGLRMAMLAEGCRRAGVAIEAFGPPRSLSPKGEQVVAYVSQAVAAGGPLAKHLPAACAGFARAGRALDALEGAAAPGPAELEEGRRALMFLTRLPEQLATDPVLADVFPPPPTLEVAGAPPAPAPRAAVPPAGRARQGAAARAGRVVAELAPKFDIVRVIALMLDPTRAMQLRDIVNDTAALARKVAQRLRRYPREVGQLQEAEALFVKLRRELDMRGEQMSDAEVGALLDPLLTLVAKFHRAMELGDLFPTNQMPAFD